MSSSISAIHGVLRTKLANTEVIEEMTRAGIPGKALRLACQADPHHQPEIRWPIATAAVRQLTMATEVLLCSTSIHKTHRRFEQDQNLHEVYRKQTSTTREHMERRLFRVVSTPGHKRCVMHCSPRCLNMAAIPILTWRKYCRGLESWNKGLAKGYKLTYLSI